MFCTCWDDVRIKAAAPDAPVSAAVPVTLYKTRTNVNVTVR